MLTCGADMHITASRNKPICCITDISLSYPAGFSSAIAKVKRKLRVRNMDIHPSSRSLFKNRTA
jgi:hypothetical protein